MRTLVSGVRTVVFTDLDDTLFRTAAKIPAAELARSVCAARASNGRDSFATPREQALLEWLDPARTVPVTARGSDAFARVLLPFAGPAVVAHGAAILGADGTPDPDWQGRVRAALAPHRAALDALPERVRAEAARRRVAVRTWLVEEPRCGGVYAVVKASDTADGDALRALVPALTAAVDPGDGDARWRLHLNGNNLALIPPGVSKAAATAYLLARLREAGEVLAIGVGDSASDLDFMRLCDLWMTPAGSQIDRLTVRASDAAERASGERRERDREAATGRAPSTAPGRPPRKARGQAPGKTRGQA